MINDTGVIGQVITGLTASVTGSLFFTYLLIVILLVVIMLLMRISFEWQIIIIMPLLVGLMAYMQDFVPIGGVALIFMGAMFAYYFMRIE